MVLLRFNEPTTYDSELGKPVLLTLLTINYGDLYIGSLPIQYPVTFKGYIYPPITFINRNIYINCSFLQKA